MCSTYSNVRMKRNILTSLYFTIIIDHCISKSLGRSPLFLLNNYYKIIDCQRGSAYKYKTCCATNWCSMKVTTCITFKISLSPFFFSLSLLFVVCASSISRSNMSLAENVIPVSSIIFYSNGALVFFYDVTKIRIQSVQKNAIFWGVIFKTSTTYFLGRLKLQKIPARLW